MKSRTLALLLSLLLLPFSIQCLAQQTGQEANAMKTYAIFFGFTSRGIEEIKKSPARVKAAKDTVRKLGGEVKAFYGILGSGFDTIFILEAPNDEAVAKMALAIAAGGNVRTETHRLFTEEQYGNLISELP